MAVTEGGAGHGTKTIDASITVARGIRHPGGLARHPVDAEGWAGFLDGVSGEIWGATSNRSGELDVWGNGWGLLFADHHVSLKCSLHVPHLVYHVTIHAVIST